jgi:hypothetical protein
MARARSQEGEFLNADRGNLGNIQKDMHAVDFLYIGNEIMYSSLSGKLLKVSHIMFRFSSVKQKTSLF